MNALTRVIICLKQCAGDSSFVTFVLCPLPFALALVLSFGLYPLPSALQAQAPPPAGEFKPPPAPEQPIAYSHKTHVALGLQCSACHATAETDDRATLPATSTCMQCHATAKVESTEIQKLAGYHTRKEEVPWRRVYRLPDYVYFSHQVHAPADKSFTCDACHGAVRDMTVMQKVKDTSMAACTECHTQRNAPKRCDSCHEQKG